MDLAHWSDVDNFRIDQAAYLWVGREPPQTPVGPLVDPDGDPSDVTPCLQMLVGATEAGQLLTVSGKTSSMWHGRDLVVSRRAMIDFSIKNGIKLPEFLRDASRVHPLGGLFGLGARFETDASVADKIAAPTTKEVDTAPESTAKDLSRPEPDAASPRASDQGRPRARGWYIM